MRAPPALLRLLALALLVARTDANCNEDGKHAGCLEDNQQPRIPLSAKGDELNGDSKNIKCYVLRYGDIFNMYCYGSADSCNEVGVIQHWNGHERWSGRTWGCHEPPSPPPPPPARPPPPVKCDDLETREDLFDYDDEGLTEPLSCENVYQHEGGKEKGCENFYQSLPGIASDWGAREYLFCIRDEHGACFSSAPTTCHLPSAVGAVAAAGASCTQLKSSYESRCGSSAIGANSVRHPDTGKPMIDDGAELAEGSATMCKLVDNVLAGHGFGMFVLGMLCGLACAFCAYLLITRCRSQPKQRRPFYSDEAPAQNTRGAQGDVAEL